MTPAPEIFSEVMYHDKPIIGVWIAIHTNPLFERAYFPEWLFTRML